MIGKLLLWTRRNTKKAIALAAAPGLAVLALDAGMAHFFGTENDKFFQYVPVYFGPIALVLVAIAVVPKSRAVFAWISRVVGFVGVAVGVTGSGFHVMALKEALKGDYSWENFQGTVNGCPPLFAPLGFAAIGALLMFLPSSKLFLRLKVGKPVAETAPTPAPVVAMDGQRKAG